jgi:peptide/nickel transport system permease protein
LEIEKFKGMNESLFWRRFKKNKLSVPGIIFIGITLIIGILGYVITPDSSPYANQQILSLAAKPPLFKTSVIYVAKNQEFDKKSFFGVLVGGKEPTHTIIPILDYKITGDSVIIQEYTGAASEIFEIKYHIVDVVFAYNPEKRIITDAKGNYRFTGVNNKTICISKKSVKQQFEKNNIKVKRYLLGTDKFGRDLLSRLFIGSRVSLSVGFISVFISLLIGIPFGVIAGYYRKKTDAIVMWIVNVVWSVPTLLMVLSISLVLGKGFWQVFVAVGLTMWVEVARIIRGQVISIREKEYIEAAKALGYNDFRIIFRHILPNVIGPVIIVSAANFSSAILMEAGLSFLGIGVQPPMPSWGSMIKDHYGYIILNQAYLAIIPGIAIMLMVLAFNFIGNGLRDAFDTKMN